MMPSHGRRRLAERTLRVSERLFVVGPPARDRPLITLSDVERLAVEEVAGRRVAGAELVDGHDHIEWARASRPLRQCRPAVDPSLPVPMGATCQSQYLAEVEKVTEQQKQMQPERSGAFSRLRRRRSRARRLGRTRYAELTTASEGGCPAHNGSKRTPAHLRAAPRWRQAH
jgi:hypothetical protein